MRFIATAPLFYLVLLHREDVGEHQIWNALEPAVDGVEGASRPRRGQNPHVVLLQIVVRMTKIVAHLSLSLSLSVCLSV